MGISSNPLVNDGKYYASYDPETAGQYQLHVQLLRVGGLSATFYRNSDFSGAVYADQSQQDSYGMQDLCPAPFTVSCDLSRIDSTVDFTWRFDSPLLGVRYVAADASDFPSDFWSAEWNGFIFPPDAAEGAERIEFELSLVIDADAQASVDYNGSRIISVGNVDAKDTPSIVRVSAVPDEQVPISIRYRENLGEAQIRVLWRSLADGADAAFVPVPSENLAYIRDISRSPQAVVVNPGESDATRTDATGEGLSAGVAGDVSSFIVTSRDSQGNARYISGLDDMIVDIVGVNGWAA